MKTYLKIIGVAVYIYASFWTFNHINPWLGILLFLVLIGFVINFLTKQINK